jgi:predicted metal-dependent phosphoesterase TrpH
MRGIIFAVTTRKADLHLHTSFSEWRSLHLIDPQDCYVRPEAAFRQALARGMDYVCFTDHNTINGALDFLARHPEQEARVIVGEEVEVYFPGTTQWLHVNVYGVDERLHDDLRRLRANCFEAIQYLTAQRAFFVLNHPFQSFRSIRAARCGLDAVLPLFPAIEVANSASPRSHVQVVRTLLEQGNAAGMAPVGGSDAHTLTRIAAVYTEAPGDTKEDFLANVRLGRSAIGGAPQGLPALVRDIYSIVGSYYRDLYSPGYALPWTRRAKNLFWSGLLAPAVVLGVPLVLPSLHYFRQEWIARQGRWAQPEVERRALTEGTGRA